jgi:hypothetical protein
MSLAFFPEARNYFLSFLILTLPFFLVFGSLPVLFRHPQEKDGRDVGHLAVQAECSPAPLLHLRWSLGRCRACQDLLDGCSMSPVINVKMQHGKLQSARVTSQTGRVS